MLEPQGRVVLISGASRGIGRAIAEDLLARGYRLSLGVRDVENTATAMGHIAQDRLHIAHFDAGNWNSHRAWVESAVQHFGKIDALINNAGAHHPMTLAMPDEKALDDLWAVNCKAPLNLVHCALPYLEKSGTGRIVNIASLSGKRVRNDAVAYNMTKFAMLALTHNARRIAWDKGVRATAICPSFVQTDMTAGAAFPAEQMTRPDDLAKIVAHVLTLPNNATVAEVLVNCRLEDTV